MMIFTGLSWVFLVAGWVLVVTDPLPPPAVILLLAAVVSAILGLVRLK